MRFSPTKYLRFEKLLLYFYEQFEKRVSVLMMESYIKIDGNCPCYLANLDHRVSLDETFIILLVRVVLTGGECDGGEIRGGA